MPLKRFLPYMGFVLAIFIIVSQQTIWAYTESIAGKLLVDIVRFETRGKYTINYEKVRFSFFNDQLFLTNFSVEEVDHLIDLDSTKQPNFSLKSTGLSIDVNSVFDMLINQTIELEGLEVINPQLHVLVDQRNLEEIPEKLSFDEVFELVTKYFEDFNIQYLNIEHAELNIVKITEDTVNTFRLKDVSLNLEHIVNINPLDHDEESIRINHYEFELLEDSLSIIPGYLLTFKNLTGSSRDSLITVKDLALIPTENSDQNLKLDLRFHEITLSSLGFRDILVNHAINSGHLKILKGDINIDINNLDKPKTNTNSNLIPITLDGIEIIDSDLNISLQNDSIAGSMKMNGINLSTGGISVIDPTNVNPQEILKTLRICRFILIGY